MSPTCLSLLLSWTLLSLAQQGFGVFFRKMRGSHRRTAHRLGSVMILLYQVDRHSGQDLFKSERLLQNYLGILARLGTGVQGNGQSPGEAAYSREGISYLVRYRLESVGHHFFLLVDGRKRRQVLMNLLCRELRNLAGNPHQCTVGFFHDLHEVLLFVYLQLQALGDGLNLGECFDNDFMDVFMTESEDPPCLSVKGTKCSRRLEKDLRKESRQIT